MVEDPSNEGRFSHKISDFGIGCQLPKNSVLIRVDSIMGGSLQNEEYNPFLADSYSLGLVAIKMINNNWGKKQIKEGLLSFKEKFEGYQPILELLKRMLEKDPQN